VLQPQECGSNQFFDPNTGLCVKRPSQPAVCPADRPVGAYPNCCPTGTHFVGRRCVRDQEQQQQPPRQITCPDGRVVMSYAMCRIGRHTQPQPQVHDCPPGYKVLTKPNKYGAYCEIIPVTPPPPAPPPLQCTGGKVAGSNGRCVCPAGKQENNDGQCMNPVN